MGRRDGGVLSLQTLADSRCRGRRGCRGRRAPGGRGSPGVPEPAECEAARAAGGAGASPRREAEGKPAKCLRLARLETEVTLWDLPYSFFCGLRPQRSLPLRKVVGGSGPRPGRRGSDHPPGWRAPRAAPCGGLLGPPGPLAWGRMSAAGVAAAARQVEGPESLCDAIGVPPCPAALALAERPGLLERRGTQALPSSRD